jgi:hypothetical protein
VSNFEDIRSDYDEFFRYANSAWQPFLQDASLAMESEAGVAFTNYERQVLAREGRDAVELNIARPVINFFSGYARDNIKSTIVAPVENSDQQTADQLSAVMKRVYDSGNANGYLNDAFHHSLIAGISLVGIWLDLSEDGTFGDIKFYKRGYNSFLIDPNFENLDLSDASQVLLRDYVTKEQAKGLLPFIDPEIIDEMGNFTMDDKFQRLRPSRTMLFNRSQTLLAFDSYYRRVTKSARFLVDMSSGDEIEFTGTREEEKSLREVMALAEQEGIQTRLINRTKHEVELNILLNGQVVYSGADPTGIVDTFPFVPIVAHFRPALQQTQLRLQGLAIGLREVQRTYSKQMVKMIDLMNSTINSGYFYKPTSLADPEAMSQSGAVKNIPVTGEADLNSDFREITRGQLLPGWLEFTNQLPGLAQQIAGVNESMLGSDEGGNSQVSGRLAEVRASQGLRANRSIFDNYELSQKLLGKLVLKAIQENYGPGKVRRMINEEPTPQFNDKRFERYDAVIKQGVLSQTQRDSFYFELLRAREVGIQIPDSLIIENMPMVGKSELMEAIKAQEEQAQAAAMQQQQDLERRRALEDSLIDERQALARERRARAVADIGLARERISESRQNRANQENKMADTTLKRLEAVEKIQDMRQDRVLKVLEFLRGLEELDLVEESPPVQEPQVSPDVQLPQGFGPINPQPEGG